MYYSQYYDAADIDCWLCARCMFLHRLSPDRGTVSGEGARRKAPLPSAHIAIHHIPRRLPVQVFQPYIIYLNTAIGRVRCYESLRWRGVAPLLYNAQKVIYVTQHALAQNIVVCLG